MSTSPSLLVLKNTFTSITRDFKFPSSLYSSFLSTHINNKSSFISILNFLSSFITASPFNGFPYLTCTISFLSQTNSLSTFLPNLLQILQANTNISHISDIIINFDLIVTNLKQNFTFEHFTQLNQYCLVNMTPYPVIAMKCYSCLIKNSLCSKYKEIRTVICKDIIEYLDKERIDKKGEMIEILKIFVLTCKQEVAEYGDEIMGKVIDCLEIDDDKVKLSAMEIIKLMLVYWYEGVVLRRNEIDFYVNKIKRSGIERDGMIWKLSEDIIDLLYNEKYIDDDITLQCNNKDDNVHNGCVYKEYDDKISNIIYQMKQITDKQLHLIDTITTVQENSVNQFNIITNRIIHLENAVSSLVTNNVYLTQNDNNIINIISSYNKEQIQQLLSDEINSHLLKIIPLLMKGKYLSQCISFIKALLILTNNKKTIPSNIINNLHEALTHIINQAHVYQINENEKIDILLVISFINNN